MPTSLRALSSASFTFSTTVAVIRSVQHLKTTAIYIPATLVRSGCAESVIAILMECTDGWIKLRVTVTGELIKESWQLCPEMHLDLRIVCKRRQSAFSPRLKDQRSAFTLEFEGVRHLGALGFAL